MGIYDRGYYRDDAGLDLKPDWNQRSAVSWLIIANVAVFILNILLRSGTDGFGESQQGRVNELLLLRSSDASQPWYWWHTLSYAFAHDSRDIFHLFFNMLSLYFLGRPVEQVLGRNEFFRVYLIAAWFCGAMWLSRVSLLGGGSSVLGASGAVLCISMLFVFNFPRATIYFMVFPMPAWVFGILLVVMNFAFTSNQKIAYDVHLFGIAFAAMYFFLRWNFVFLSTPIRSFQRFVRRVFRPKLRVHSEGSGNEFWDSAEADRILAKIHESGKDSLTKKEKAFLERYSQAVKRKKSLDL
jgi:membrane associated rhomboid family serine protease